MSANGLDHARPSPADPLERDDPAQEAATKAAAPVVRATQINRCLDAGGRIVLRDLPCEPVVAKAPASAPDTSADIVDLAHLEKRPLPEPVTREPREPESRFRERMLNAGWKVGLLVAVCYGIWWAFRTVRTWLRYRRLQAELAAESVRYSRTPVRPSRR